MNFNLKGALKNINKLHNVIEHNGKFLSKELLKKILIYGINKGYENAKDFKEFEIDKIIEYDL